MARDFTSGNMATLMTESGFKESNTDTGAGRVLMAIVISVSGCIIKLMVMESMSGLTAINMRDAGGSASDMDRVMTSLPMVTCTSASTPTVELKAMACTSGPTVTHTLESLRTA